MFLFGKGNTQVSIDVPVSNIYNRSDYEQLFEAGRYTNLLNLLPTFRTRSTESAFSNNGEGVPSVPLGRAHIRLTEVAGLSLIGLSEEVPLTTSWQVLAGSVANLLASGPVIANFRLSVNEYTWRAGQFSAEVAFRAPGLLGIGNQISPESKRININIPVFMIPQWQVDDVLFEINDFNIFRVGEGIQLIRSGSISSTVPYMPGIQAENSQFLFASAGDHLPLPGPSADHVKVEKIGSSSIPVSLSSMRQNLTSVPMDVPVGNSRDVSQKFSISRESLRTGFLQAGTYSLPMIHYWKKQTHYPPGEWEEYKNSTFKVIVDEMGEVIAEHQNVDLIFSTTLEYQTGIIKDMPQHLRISHTTPYDLYVRAASGSFASGNESIPLDVMQVGPMPGQVGMNTITLSDTPQKLIQSAEPVMDRYLDVRYQIPASETHQLLDKGAGQYTVDIIYSIVAP